MSKVALDEPVQKQTDSWRSRERLEESADSRQSADGRILQLQRAMGNRRVAELIGSGQIAQDARLLPIQTRLRVGAPDDPYEQEADAVAEEVLARTSLAASSTSGSDDDDDNHRRLARKAAYQESVQRNILRRIPIRTLQQTLGNRALARLLQEKIPAPAIPALSRKCACGGDAKEECAECRENRLARQSNSDGAGSEAPPIVEDVLATPGQQLAESTRRTLEPGFGHDFSEVRVHDDSRAADSASAVSALAYTVGNHIVFGAGQYSPGTNDGNRLLAHELTHTIQQTGGTPTNVQRFSLDDLSNAVSNVGSGIAEGAEAVGSAVSSGAQAVGSAVSSGAQAVGSAVSSGAQAVGSAVSSGEQAVGSAVSSGAQAVGSAVSSGAQAAAGAVAGTVGSAALDAANALAGLFGGTVSVTPSGGIVITIPDVEIAEVEDETHVIPLGIPTEPLFEAGFEVGTFTMLAYVGTIYGDPAVTLSVGPVKLQNIALMLDPGAGTYAGTAQLYIGSAVSGSVEKATEARIQAAGVIPMEPPIPVEGSAAVGIRTILRLVGKEGFTDTVTVGYSGGSFILREAFDVKLGALAEVAHEAFLRIEIETEEICSVIWPISKHSLGKTGIEISVPVTVNTGGGDPVTIGDPKTNPISPDDIPTGLQDNHEPEHCMGLEELAKFLCDKGKVPPDICAILLPGKPGRKGVGPVPVVPLGGGGGGSGTGPVGPQPVGPVGPLGGDPCRDDVFFRFERRFFKDGAETKVLCQDSKHARMAKKTDRELREIADVSDCNSLPIPCEKDFCNAAHARDEGYGSQIDKATRRESQYKELLEDAFRFDKKDRNPPRTGEWIIQPNPADQTVGYDVAAQALTDAYTVHGNFTNDGKNLKVRLFPGEGKE